MATSAALCGRRLRTLACRVLRPLCGVFDVGPDTHYGAVIRALCGAVIRALCGAAVVGYGARVAVYQLVGPIAFSMVDS